MYVYYFKRCWKVESVICCMIYVVGHEFHVVALLLAISCDWIEKLSPQTSVPVLSITPV